MHKGSGRGRFRRQSRQLGGQPQLQNLSGSAAAPHPAPDACRWQSENCKADRAHCEGAREPRSPPCPLLTQNGWKALELNTIPTDKPHGFKISDMQSLSDLVWETPSACSQRWVYSHDTVRAAPHKSKPKCFPLLLLVKSNQLCS